MSKCTITIFGTPEGDVSITFEGDTVVEALAMKAEYLLNVGLTATPPEGETVEVSPSTPKPSGFLSKVKGGE